MGDLQRLSGLDPGAEEPLPTHLIMPGADPGIDEMVPYAPGRPDINREIMAETGFGVPSPPSGPLSGVHQQPSYKPPPGPPRPLASSGSADAHPLEPPPEPWQTLGDVVARQLAQTLDPDHRDLATRFVTRIEITAAWQFNVNVAAAPVWVDRNWLAWDDGPAIAVRRADGSLVGMARRGDWIVRQNVTVDDPERVGRTITMPDQIGVITESEFARLYRTEIVPISDPQMIVGVPSRRKSKGGA